MTEQNRQRAVRLFVAVLAPPALANRPGSNIFSNYFNEVFHIGSVQRGFIEIPRESPGILCMVLVAALGFMGNLWMSVVAQALVLVGLIVMGWMSPSYGTMLVFLFIHSLGMHLFMPLNDAISMDLAEQGKVGATLGRFKGVNTLFSMAAAGGPPLGADSGGPPPSPPWRRRSCSFWGPAPACSALKKRPFCPLFWLRS